MMQRKFSFGIAVLGTIILAVSWLIAQEKTSVRLKDEEAVKAAAQELAKAFESGNEKALTALFTDDAEYIDEDSEPVHGHEALAKAYRDLFADRKEVKAEAKTDTVRFLGTDTAIEEGTFTVTAKDSPPNKSRYSALHVRQDGKWLIALLKEWQNDEPEQPKLEDLSWLIGTWETAGPEMTARTTYSWTANKAFIRADFTITPKKEGEKPSTGTQVIGVDPAVGHIRAWLFGSDGGIGESNWSWDGERWTIESVGTLADGEHTSAVNFMARDGKDAFTWRSVERHLAGERQPDIAAVTVKRVADAAAGAKGK